MRKDKGIQKTRIRTIADSHRAKRGFVLIGSYLTVGVFLVYMAALSVRATTQRLLSERLRDQYQATNLAQAALEQLREDLHQFLTSEVYSLVSPSDPMTAMTWLDDLGNGNEIPEFDLALRDQDGDGQLTVADLDGMRDGRADNPRCLGPAELPGIQSSARCQPTTTTVEAPRAWIVSVVAVDPADPFSARLVTMEAEAAAGSVNKHLRAVFQTTPTTSDVFRYAYFINNYGWINHTPRRYSGTGINGDVRSNGDLRFSGDMVALRVSGDAYAAAHPDLVDPLTLMSATGQISGDPNQENALWYWLERSWQQRPTRQLTFPDQPPIGNAPMILPAGHGYDVDLGDQRRFTAQEPIKLPTLGDLTVYRKLATQKGSSLTYTQPGLDYTYGTADDQRATIQATYDQTTPLVLIGTPDKPIVINGPVVVPGDVVIRGAVTGRGAIYSGRNIHIVGEVKYQLAPSWKPLERDTGTGKIRVQNRLGHYTLSSGDYNMGAVCDNGVFVPPTELPPPSCGQGFSDTWVPYGYTLPGDPLYGFGEPQPDTQDLLGLVAKGNVIIGDYTRDVFRERVLPKLTRGTPESITQPYVIDPTDATLGYDNYSRDAKDRPRFSGDYTAYDGGSKDNGQPRRFYESSLSTSAFRSLVDQTTIWNGQYPQVKIDAVLFAHHVIAGTSRAKSIMINGGVIGWDYAVSAPYGIVINHDIRLLDKKSAWLGLPLKINRPQVVSWKVCAPSGCGS